MSVMHVNGEASVLHLNSEYCLVLYFAKIYTLKLHSKVFRSVEKPNNKSVFIYFIAICCAVLCSCVHIIWCICF